MKKSMLHQLAMAAIAILIACALMPVAASAQTCNGLTTPQQVVNGGFQSGSGFIIPLPWMVAWDSTADPYMLISTGGHLSSQALWMGAIPGSNRISQSLPRLTAGSVYTLCFWLSNDNNCCASSFEATWNDNNVLEMVNNAGFGYQYYSFQVVAVGGGRDVLSFQARQVPAYYYLDDVSVQLCTGCFFPFSPQEQQGKKSGPGNPTD